MAAPALISKAKGVKMNIEYVPHCFSKLAESNYSQPNATGQAKEPEWVFRVKEAMHQVAKESTLSRQQIVERMNAHAAKYYGINCSLGREKKLTFHTFEKMLAPGNGRCFPNLYILELFWFATDGDMRPLMALLSSLNLKIVSEEDSQFYFLGRSVVQSFSMMQNLIDKNS